jgi:hypothetical protein
MCSITGLAERVPSDSLNRSGLRAGDSKFSRYATDGANWLSDGMSFHLRFANRYLQRAAPTVVCMLMVTACGGSSPQTTAETSPVTEVAVSSLVPTTGSIAPEMTPTVVPSSLSPTSIATGTPDTLLSLARWSTPGSEEQLSENLRMAGFPDDWPLPPNIGPKTVSVMIRQIYEFDLEHVHYKTAWRIESTDVNAAAAQWFPSVPETYMPAGFEESSGTESFGIFGDTKYVEQLARNEAGFATTTARVQTVNNLETNQPEAIELKLEWEGPVDGVTPFTPASVITDEALWSWQSMLPDLRLGEPVCSDLTVFDVEVPDPVMLSLTFNAGIDAEADAAIDRLRDPAIWTKGATFEQSNPVASVDNMESDITFTIAQPGGDPLKGRIQRIKASESGTAKVKIVLFLKP